MVYVWFGSPKTVTWLLSCLYACNIPSVLPCSAAPPLASVSVSCVHFLRPLEWTSQRLHPACVSMSTLIFSTGNWRTSNSYNAFCDGRRLIRTHLRLTSIVYAFAKAALVCYVCYYANFQSESPTQQSTSLHTWSGLFRGRFTNLVLLNESS